MPIIRRSYNYGCVFLAPNLISGKGFCGQTVEVVQMFSENTIEKFSGFIPFEYGRFDDHCVVTKIEAFTRDDDYLFCEWHWYDKDDWLLGRRLSDGVHLITMENGLPLVVSKSKNSKLPDSESTIKRVDNVTHLHKHRA